MPFLRPFRATAEGFLLSRRLCLLAVFTLQHIGAPSSRSRHSLPFSRPRNPLLFSPPVLFPSVDSVSREVLSSMEQGPWAQGIPLAPGPAPTPVLPSLPHAVLVPPL